MSINMSEHMPVHMPAHTPIRVPIHVPVHTSACMCACRPIVEDEPLSFDYNTTEWDMGEPFTDWATGDAVRVPSIGPDIGFISASPTACLLRGYGRAGHSK